MLLSICIEHSLEITYFTLPIQLLIHLLCSIDNINKLAKLNNCDCEN